MDRINKSKEEGWKNLVDSLEDNKEVQSMCMGMHMHKHICGCMHMCF